MVVVVSAASGVTAGASNSGTSSGLKSGAGNPLHGRTGSGSSSRTYNKIISTFKKTF